MNWHYTYCFLFHSRFFCKRTYTDGFSANPLIVCVFLCIFQLISSLPTYPPTNVNLTYTYPYLFHSRCFYKRTYTDGLSANPLIVCVFLCIFQLISSLPTYPPTNGNLTFTYPYLFHSRFCSLGTWSIFITVPP